jgi:hypothetical protein
MPPSGPELRHCAVVTTVLGFCAAILASLLLPAPARAYEDRLTAGPLVGMGISSENSLGSEFGIVAGVTASVGLDDVWNVRLTAGNGVHPGPDLVDVAFGSLELLYTVDIVEWVPFFGGGVDGVFVFADGSSIAEPGFHGTVGIDRWLSRTWLIGLDLRGIVLPFLENGPGLAVDPVYVTATIRAEWVFDL